MTKPDEFTTALYEGASATHEMFREFVKAGFTEQQALYLVGQQLVASVNNPPQPPTN